MSKLHINYNKEISGKLVSLENKIFSNIPSIVFGVPAALNTNERVLPGFFEIVSKHQPNGYIIGIGAGAIFSLLYAFPDHVPPKAIVSIDVDPRVITIGKLTIEILKQSSSSEAFITNLFKLSKKTFVEKINKIIVRESNESLKLNMQKFDSKEWEKAYDIIRFGNPAFWKEKTDYLDNFPFPTDSLNHLGTSNVIHLPSILTAKFDLLHKLALADKIAFVYANFTDSTLIDMITALPDFGKVKSIIYSSNIIAHITERGAKFERSISIDTLRVYEHKGNKNIFIDASNQTDYFLRAGIYFPYYSLNDVLPDAPRPPREKLQLFFPKYK